MILEWIHKKLSRLLNQKKQDVVRLRWEEDQLRQQLDRMKKEKGELQN